MLYILYDCPGCLKNVSAPLTPERTLPADTQTEQRTVHCPSCKKETIVEIACRIYGQKKKRGRPRGKRTTVPLVIPDTDPTELALHSSTPQTGTDPKTDDAPSGEPEPGSSTTA